MTKYIITGPHLTNKFEVGEILNISPHFKCAKYFTSNINDKSKDYLNNLEVNNGYNNNAFLIVKDLQNGTFEGITIQEYEASNVIVMEMYDFNSISEAIIEASDIVVIWIDSSSRQNTDYVNKDILETKYLIERLEFTKYMYFLNEQIETIIKVITSYQLGSEEDKKELLEKYL